MFLFENLILQEIDKTHVYYEIEDTQNPTVNSRIRILFDQTKINPEVSFINPIEIYDEENEIDNPIDYIYSDKEIEMLKAIAIRDYHKYLKKQ